MSNPEDLILWAQKRTNVSVRDADGRISNVEGMTPIRAIDAAKKVEQIVADGPRHVKIFGTKAFTLGGDVHQLLQLSTPIAVSKDSEGRYTFEFDVPADSKVPERQRPAVPAESPRVKGTKKSKS